MNALDERAFFVIIVPKNIMKKLSEIILLLCMVFFSLAKSSEFKDNFRETKIIQIAGIVMDAENLNPLENAKLYDEQGKLISTTDTKGYFVGKVNYSGKNAIHFKIKIEKKGYLSFTQKENWGNLGSEIQSIYYFGIEKIGSKVKNNSFSEMKFNKDLTYDSVLSGFGSVKDKISFNHKLESAKYNNENVFFTIDQEYLILNNGGWLKITSPNDNVSINKRRTVKASELNSLIKKNQIKGMTPSESKDYSYEIYTK